MSSQPVTKFDRQIALETRAEKLSASDLEHCTNLRDLLGSAKEWVLEIGPYRFLLIPFLREWWVYDQPHKEWRSTGRHIGEVRFVFDGKQLTLQDVRTAATKPAAATAKPAAEHSGTGVRRFCPSCGAPAEAGWKFCQACGGQLPQGADTR